MSNPTITEDSLNPNRSSKTTLAAAELEHRKQEIQKRQVRHEAEKNALCEIRDLLQTEDLFLRQNLASEKEELGRLTNKLNASLKTQATIKTDIENIEREITILEGRLSEQAEYTRSLEKDITQAEKNWYSGKEWVSSTTLELELSRAVLKRLDQKISRKVNFETPGNTKTQGKQ